MGTGEFTAVHGTGVQAMAIPLNLIHDGIVCEPIGNLETPKVVFVGCLGIWGPVRVFFRKMMGIWKPLRVFFHSMIGNLETPKGRFPLDDWEIGARKWFSGLQ